VSCVSCCAIIIASLKLSNNLGRGLGHASPCLFLPQCLAAPRDDKKEESVALGQGHRAFFMPKGVGGEPSDKFYQSIVIE
jgi:hypothetical protein